MKWPTLQVLPGNGGVVYGQGRQLKSHFGQVQPGPILDVRGLNEERPCQEKVRQVHFRIQGALLHTSVLEKLLAKNYSYFRMIVSLGNLDPRWTWQQAEAI